jgi:glycerate 2-kinase
MQLPATPVIRRQLEHWLHQAVAAVDPFEATRRVLDEAPPPTTPPGIIALGKAAEGMARAAVDWLARHRLEPAGGIVVTDQLPAPPHPNLSVAIGDHPNPGPASLAAAEALAQCIAALPPGVPVHVFLSGGTSSLLAAPLPGITPAEMRHAFELFHSLGLEISSMNGLRQRLTRWSGGRLAEALGDRSVQAWVISDVIGNDLATIGSGPLVNPSVDLDDLVSLLTHPGAIATLSPAVREALGRAAPAPRRSIRHRIVADGTMAAAALADAARLTADGTRAVVHKEAIVGDATVAGVELGKWIHDQIRTHRLPPRDSGILVEPVARVGVVHVWTSETTVKLPDVPGLGGRAQQFALSAAGAIGDLGWPDAATVMIAATDGRDGPTDAAGAIINAGTAGAILESGFDIEATLARCDAHTALDPVGALLRTGRTGTNVADLVVVWVWNWY